MKKSIFAFALMFGVMFASCGNSTSTVSTDKDSIDTARVDSLNADTTSGDSMHVSFNTNMTNSL